MMIATLRGRVLERGSGRIVIDVGGVGYLLAATSAAIRMAVPDGEEVTLVTHLHVREDALILFGFAVVLFLSWRLARGISRVIGVTVAPSRRP